MVTLGVALVLGELANQNAWLTGGADGLQGVMINPIFGLFEFDLYGRTAYIYALVVTFLLFIVARRIVVSPFGLSLRSIPTLPRSFRLSEDSDAVGSNDPEGVGAQRLRVSLYAPLA